jgi:hypothetical protein
VHNAFQPSTNAPICTIEGKYFIPYGHVDWFKNPIPTPEAFEEGNMANISPTIKTWGIHSMNLRHSAFFRGILKNTANFTRYS